MAVPSRQCLALAGLAIWGNVDSNKGNAKMTKKTKLYCGILLVAAVAIPVIIYLVPNLLS